jgi:hypothetical protein
MGRQINGKFIPSATRKGTADISATIKGRSVMIEIKLAEQQRERQAGGIYEFVHTPEEFFIIFDQITSH